MSHSQTVLFSPDGWGWPKPDYCPPVLMPIVSNLEQVRQNIYRTVAGLKDEYLWVRIAPQTPAIGNLLLHLAGTEHQWIGVKIGRLPLQRDRNYEFSATGGKTLAELLQQMQAIQAQTQSVLRGLQGGENRAVNLEIQFNLHYTVQHFAYHSGQLVTIRKMFEPDFQVYPGN